MEELFLVDLNLNKPTIPYLTESCILGKFDYDLTIQTLRKVPREIDVISIEEKSVHVNPHILLKSITCQPIPEYDADILLKFKKAKTGMDCEWYRDLWEIYLVEWENRPADDYPWYSDEENDENDEDEIEPIIGSAETAKDNSKKCDACNQTIESGADYYLFEDGQSMHFECIGKCVPVNCAYCGKLTDDPICDWGKEFCSEYCQKEFGRDRGCYFCGKKAYEYYYCKKFCEKKFCNKSCHDNLVLKKMVPSIKNREKHEWIKNHKCFE